MPPDAACILTGKKYPDMKRHGNFPSPCLLIHISEESSAVCPRSGKKEIPLQPSGKNTDFISEAAPENQAFKAVMSSVHVSGRSLHPDNQRSIHDSSGLFSFPPYAERIRYIHPGFPTAAEAVFCLGPDPRVFRPDDQTAGLRSFPIGSERFI